MKNQLRRLHLLFLLTKLSPEMFYKITYSAYEIRLQGKYNYKLVKHLKRIGYDFKYSDSGFSELIINNINIVLT